MSKVNFFVAATGELSYEITSPIMTETTYAIAITIIQISHTLKRIRPALGAIDKDLDAKS